MNGHTLVFCPSNQKLENFPRFHSKRLTSCTSVGRYIDGGPPAGEPDMSSSIWRRYSEFELLRNYLVANFPSVSKHLN